MVTIELPSTQEDKLSWLSDLVSETKRHGADDAEAVIFSSQGVSVSVRKQSLEQLDRAESHGLGLRVMIGKKQAFISTSDVRDVTVRELVERAVSMARVMPDNPYMTLASSADYAQTLPLLDVYDDTIIAEKHLCELAMQCEASALDHPDITQSEGSQIGYSHSTVSMVLSRGFAHSYQLSDYSIGASVVAGSDADMHVDGESYSARYYADLPHAHAVGCQAATLTAAHLHPRAVETQNVPVIFDPRVAGSLVRYLLSGINGMAIARGTSFLQDALHTSITDYPTTIIDDPLRLRGLSSRPFDAEGLPSSQRVLLDKGIITGWLLDLERATQLHMEPTGGATRGLASAPTPGTSNVHMEPGIRSPESLMADITSGLYVTDVMGMGVSTVTGAYSQGVRGYWIENGRVAYPVQELTIASDLRTMFRTMEPANDLQFRYRVNVPTLRIASMTVASQGS